jgi:hypothetical protein
MWLEASMRSDRTRSARGILVALVVAGAAPSIACSGSAGSSPQSLPALSIPIEPAPPPPDDIPPPPPAAPAPPPQLPDPPALLSAEQYELDLVYERGAVTLRSASLRRFAQPVATARRLGRFAIELWVGEELVERVRFDFPLLAAPQENEGGSAAGLDAGLVTSQKVLVPASDRARRALLVDRSNGKEQPLPWPPITPAATAAAGETPDDGSLPEPSRAASPQPVGVASPPAAAPTAAPTPASTPSKSPLQPSPTALPPASR